VKEQENTYVIDAESGAETARLLDQDHLMTQALGGLFPKPVETYLHEGATILDLGCGPGGWVQEVVHAFPGVEVVGLDNSRTIIAYARAQAKVQGLQNRVQFHVADITTLPWSFPDASFDVVNARFMVGFLHRQIWPRVVQECFRIVKPGGYVVLTEPEWGTTNSMAGERLASMALHSFHKSGLGFSFDGRQLGIIHMLDPLLRDNGGAQVEMTAHVLNMTYGREFYDAGTKNMFIAYHLMADFFVKTGLAASKEEVANLCEQMRADTYLETYSGAMVMARAWSQKL